MWRLQGQEPSQRSPDPQSQQDLKDTGSPVGTGRFGGGTMFPTVHRQELG